MYSYSKGLLLADFLGSTAQGQVVLGWLSLMLRFVKIYKLEREGEKAGDNWL